jgi:hypothetical protein
MARPYVRIVLAVSRRAAMLRVETSPSSLSAMRKMAAPPLLPYLPRRISGEEDIERAMTAT